MWGILAAIAAATMLTGCAGSADTVTSTATSVTTTTTVSPNTAIADWGKEKLADSLDALGNDFTWIGAAIKSMDFADARAGSRKLDTDVNELEAKLPSPDAQVNAHLSDAVNSLRKFSRGTQGLNPSTTESELDELSTWRERAQAELEKAVDLITAARQAAG
jgi:hypothetical protein